MHKCSHPCFAALRLLDERLLDQDEACQLLSEKTREKRRTHTGSGTATGHKRTSKGRGNNDDEGRRTVARAGREQEAPPAATARRMPKAPWIGSSLASATTQPVQGPRDPGAAAGVLSVRAVEPDSEPVEETERAVRPCCASA